MRKTHLFLWQWLEWVPYESNCVDRCLVHQCNEEMNEHEWMRMPSITKFNDFIYFIRFAISSAFFPFFFFLLVMFVVILSITNYRYPKYGWNIFHQNVNVGWMLMVLRCQLQQHDNDDDNIELMQKSKFVRMIFSENFRSTCNSEHISVNVCWNLAVIGNNHTEYTFYGDQIEKCEWEKIYIFCLLNIVEMVRANFIRIARSTRLHIFTISRIHSQIHERYRGIYTYTI